MGEPAIVQFAYRILDDLKRRTAGFDDSWRTPGATSSLPDARAFRALFVATQCRRELLLARHTYVVYGTPLLVHLD